MTAVAPAGLTQKELENARLILQQMRSSVVGATRRLTEAQWTFQSAPGQWSVAQNLDHIVCALDYVLGTVLSKVVGSPAPADRDFEAVDEIAIHQFAARLDKYPAPEFVQPRERIVPQELLDRLKTNTIRFMEYLESTPQIREHAMESAPIKAVSKGKHQLMDGYQFVLFAAGHTERHVRQMLEVMADEGFPLG